MLTLLDSRQSKRPSRELRQIGLLAAVPGLLLGGPLIGWLAGRLADRWFGTEPYLMVAGILLGLAAAGLEIYGLVKKASAIDKEDEHDDLSGT